MSNQPYQPDPRLQNYQQENVYSDDTVESANVGGAYVQNRHENYVDPAGNRVENRVQTVEDKNESRANIRYWITRVTYFLLAVLEIILGLRLLFHFLGANTGNGFITFLYDLSHVFVGAFNGIFNDQAIGNNGVFEISTVIAMLVYALIAWGIVSLGRVLFAPNLTGQQSVSTTRRSRLQ